MSITGKKANNLQVVTGVSWIDRFNMDPSSASLASAPKVMEVGGENVTYAVLFVSGASNSDFTQLNGLPVGTFAVDGTAGKLFIHTTTTAWASASLTTI